jgi:transcriptional regulator with XRE-family HTH domain
MVQISGNRFSKLLVNVRLSRALPQKVVASRLGVSSSRWSKLERHASSTPSEKVVTQIAQALNCSVHEAAQLQQAANHDRLMAETGRVFQDHIQKELVSLAIDAAMSLSADEAQSVIRSLRPLINARTHWLEHSKRMEGLAMQ